MLALLGVGIAYFAVWGGSPFRADRLISHASFII